MKGIFKVFLLACLCVFIWDNLKYVWITYLWLRIGVQLLVLLIACLILGRWLSNARQKTLQKKALEQQRQEEEKKLLEAQAEAEKQRLEKEAEAEKKRLVEAKIDTLKLTDKQVNEKSSINISVSDPSDEELEGDEMLPAAVDVILETGQASVSMLQRRLKIGYARAARILDEMEEKGFVGPFQGSKPRSILITKELFLARLKAERDLKEQRMNQKPEENSLPDESMKEEYLYYFPSIDLLKRPNYVHVDTTQEMRDTCRQLNEIFSDLNIDALITNVTRGASVTRYEAVVNGVHLNRISEYSQNIAQSLNIPGIRIKEMTGKVDIVGIEVPNKSKVKVSLRQVIDSAEFNKPDKRCFAIGRDVDGKYIIGDIAKNSNVLIAGTDVSEIAMCLNSIIVSLLYKTSPGDVKFLMIDPKMVDLGIYNGTPHLLIPVVTNPLKAVGSLQWAMSEMLRRHKMMANLGVRDLDSYNSVVSDKDDGLTLPHVFIIIDELADLMIMAAQEVEDSICRIALMGNAVGMHFIITTRCPSADVITDLIKSHFHHRIAFSVTSEMESRIILDTIGAEKLVGMGDMLYSHIDSSELFRVQGCFVSYSEVQAVTEYVKEQNVTDYYVQTLSAIENMSIQTVINRQVNFDGMTGAEFEKWCAELLKKRGFSNVKQTPASGDQGVDLLAEKDGVKYAIQCKCYSHDLGNTPVQEVYAGKAIYNCHVAAVITNRHFTAGAQEAAQATGVLLWDRDWLQRNIII